MEVKEKEKTILLWTNIMKDNKEKDKVRSLKDLRRILDLDKVKVNLVRLMVREKVDT